MRALVTGACGFIGSHMTEVLAGAGHDVIAADLPVALEAPPGDRSRWPEVVRAVGAELVGLDITDRQSVARVVKGADVVFHVAAVFDYTAPESLLRRVNVGGTRNLFEAALREGTCRRVVNWGAGGIFGLPEPASRPFTEMSPIRPSNPYLRSKWDQEVLANSYRRHGIEVTTVTPVSPYGPRALYGSGQLLIGLAQRPVALKNLTGNLPMGHVRDLCRAALHLADHAPADGQRYIVTDDGDIDAVRLATIVADETGSEPRLLPSLPLRPLRGALSVGARLSTVAARVTKTRPLLEYDQVQYFGRDWRYSNAKLKATGFTMDWPRPEPGLRETLRWYAANGWLKSKRPGGGR